MEAEDGERYLTGVDSRCCATQGDRGHAPDRRPGGAIGVNDRADLMQAEAVAQARILERHALAGVTFLQPETTRVEAGVDDRRGHASSARA